MDKAKIKRAISITLNVLLYIFLAICILLVFVTALSKKDSDGAAEIFGYQMRIVTSDSMAASEYTDVSGYEIKDIPVRSMVFVKVIPDDPEQAEEWYRHLKVGDVLTFRYLYKTQVTITHRIISIEENDAGGFTIDLAGDNKSSKDGQLVQRIDTSVDNSANYVIGKVVGQAKLLGTVMSFIMQPVGIIFIIILPCFIIILLEVLKIVRTVTDEKKKREQEERAKKESELEELRRKLAELEKEKNAQAVGQAAECASSDTEDQKEEARE